MPVAKDHRSIPVDRVVELAVALGRGDLSREKAVEGFVSLVLEARITFALPPAAGECLAAAILRDEQLSAHFDALFARLRTGPRRPQLN